MLEELLMPHINIVLITICMLPLYAIGIVLFILGPCLGLTIGIPTIFSRNSTWFINIVSFFASLICCIFLTTGLFLSYTFAHDTFTINERINRPLTENFNFTKTGGQIVIESKHPNAIRDFLQNNNVINITSETDEAYSFIKNNHVYQIPKTIVEEK